MERADLSGLAVLSDNDPGEGIREPRVVRADERPRLVDVGSDLEVLKHRAMIVPRSRSDRTYVFLIVVDRGRRRKSWFLRVQYLVCKFEARREPAGIALLVFDQTQPQVDLDLGLDLPPTGPKSSLSWQL